MMKLFDLSERRYLVFFLLTALVLRATWILLVNNEPTTDCKIYFNLAKELADLGTYNLNGNPSAYWPIGYPLFLSFFMKLFGSYYLIPKLLNVLLSLVICLFTYKITRRLYNDKTGRISGLIIAFFPSQIFYTSLSTTEILFTALFLSITWLVIKKLNTRVISMGTTIVGGLIGLAALVRPGFAMFPLVLFVYFLVSKGKLFREIKRFLAFVFTMAIVISPWIIRNYRVMGQFVFISTSGGPNFYMGNSRYATGHYVDLALIPECELHNVSSELERNRLGYQLGIRFIRKYPLRFVQNAFKKIFYLFASDVMGFYLNINSLSRIPPRWILILGNSVAQIYYMMILGLAFFEYIHFKRWRLYKSGSVGLPILAILYWIGLHIIFFGMGRYHFPIVPLFVIMGSHVIATFFFERSDEQKIIVTQKAG